MNAGWQFEGVRRLLRLAQAVPERTDVRRAVIKAPLLQRVGDYALKGWEGALEMFRFLGENIVALGNLIRGRAQFRWADAFLVMQQGRLDSESLVTGVLYVGLEIVPHAPPPVFHQLKPEYNEIPTIPSDVQQLVAELAHLDIRGLSEKLNALLTRLDSSLSQLKVAEINTGLTNLLGAANHLLASPDLTNSLAALRQTLDQAGSLLKRIDDRVDPPADSVTNTLSEAQKTLADLRIGVRNVSDVLGPDSAFRPNLRQALEELSNASRALADLAEFLERNPNALLTGKRRLKVQP